MKKTYSFLQQAFIFAIIMLISNGIAYISPIPLPASVIGMVILFIALCTNLVELNQVEALSNDLSSIIAFLFVPSGISLINSLDLMQHYAFQIVFVILVATVVLLGTTGWSASFFLKVRKNHHSKEKIEKKEKAEAKKLAEQILTHNN